MKQIELNLVMFIPFHSEQNYVMLISRIFKNRNFRTDFVSYGGRRSLKRRCPTFRANEVGDRFWWRRRIVTKTFITNIKMSSYRWPFIWLQHSNYGNARRSVCCTLMCPFLSQMLRSNLSPPINILNNLMRIISF